MWILVTCDIPFMYPLHNFNADLNNLKYKKKKLQHTDRHTFMHTHKYKCVVEEHKKKNTK